MHANSDTVPELLQIQRVSCTLVRCSARTRWTTRCTLAPPLRTSAENIRLATRLCLKSSQRARQARPRCHLCFSTPQDLSKILCEAKDTNYIASSEERKFEIAESNWIERKLAIGLIREVTYKRTWRTYDNYLLRQPIGKKDRHDR